MGRLSRYIFLLRTFLHGLRGGYARADFLKKKHYFKNIGEHCYLQPWNFGTEPHMISFGNNVHVASGVRFITHDITALMFRYIDKQCKYEVRKGSITVGNNVFIGAYSTILYDVTISNNVIIGAGSLVNKNLPSDIVAAGIPCKIIGTFEEYKKKMQIK